MPEGEGNTPTGTPPGQTGPGGTSHHTGREMRTTRQTPTVSEFPTATLVVAGP